MEREKGEFNFSLYAILCDLGQQDISRAGNSQRAGWDVGRDQAQGVELYGKQSRNGPCAGMSGFLLITTLQWWAHHQLISRNKIAYSNQVRGEHLLRCNL